VEFVQRGHEVTVLRSSVSIFIEPRKSFTIKFEVYTTSLDKKSFEDYFNELINEWVYNFPKYSLWTYYSQLQKFFRAFSDIMEMLCRDIVLNKKITKKLQESRFDVILADPVAPCGELLAELLQIPFVYTLRSLPGYTHEKYSGGIPLPPSYVPIILSELTD
jgi:glucuronosyltransferase